ncbi:MAG: hypothetical protein GYB68_19160 [Chloroflexi bacterium]|nr:hypothetical protein [Chloroflexota bacterium]
MMKRATSGAPTDLRDLRRILQRWDNRLRLQHSLRWLPRGLLIGLLIALLVGVAARIWPIVLSSTLVPLSAVLIGIGLIATLAVIWAWPRGVHQLAARFDQQFGLRDRATTALELANGAIPTQSEVIRDQQLALTMQAVSGVDARQELPLATDWREWSVVAALAIGLGFALFLPNPQDEFLTGIAETEEAIAEEIEQLEELRQEVLEDPSLTDEQAGQVLEVIDDLIETLEQDGVSQEEAVAAFNEAQQDLDDLSEEFAAERQEALQQASGLFDGTAAEEAGEALEEGNFLEAAEALENIDPSNLSPEEAAALAESLREAAEALEGSDPELAEQLEEAAEALESGDVEGAQEALEGAAGEIAENAGEAQQLDELGEALEEGQGNVAGGDEGDEGGENAPGSGGQPGEGPPQPGEGGMGEVLPDEGGEGGAPGQGQPGSSGAGDEEPGDPAQGGQAGDELPTDNNPGDGGETPFDDIFDPQRVGGEGGEDVDIPGDPGAGAPTGTEGDFAENPDGDSSVDYSDVFGDYEDAVNEALDSGYVPLGLRDLIRQYFSSLDPD